jgi:hypothetical protein
MVVRLVAEKVVVKVVMMVEYSADKKVASLVVHLEMWVENSVGLKAAKKVDQKVELST